MKKITVTRALVELKNIKKRIDKTIMETNFVSASRGNSSTTIGQMPVEKFDKAVKAKLKSVRALIQNRNNLKRAIVMSNAVVKIPINEEVYTVAEAIERKASIQHEKDLVNQLKAQLASILEKVEGANEEVESNLQSILNQLSNGDNKPSKSLIESITNTHRDQHEWRMIDPINIRDTIESLEENIDQFETSVDTVLSESNAVTFIEV